MGEASPAPEGLSTVGDCEVSRPLAFGILNLYSSKQEDLSMHLSYILTHLILWR